MAAVDDDDVPPPPPPPPEEPSIPFQNYGSADYWDQRYTREPVCFDWYQGFSGLGPLIAKHARPEEPLLHVGMGTSLLQERMVKEGGFSRIVNVDVSKVAVEQMSQLHAGIPELEYRVGDIRSLPEFEDGHFGCVLDKGTLDAILCGNSAFANAAAAVAESHRLLRPGGCFILVTYGDPDSRLQHLVGPHLNWSVQIYVTSKPPLPLVAGAEDGHEPARTVVQGPFDAAQKDCMQAINGMRGVHYMYVCTKLADAIGASAAAAAAGAAAAVGADVDGSGGGGSSATPESSQQGGGGGEHGSADATAETGRGAS